MVYQLTRQQLELILDLYKNKPKKMDDGKFLLWIIDGYFEIKRAEEGPIQRSCLKGYESLPMDKLK